MTRVFKRVIKESMHRFLIYILILAILIIAFCVGILVFHLRIAPEPYQPLSGVFYYQPRIPYYPKTYVLGTLIKQVIQCESGGRQRDKNGDLIIGKANEIGIAQFKQETWDYFNQIRGTNLDITDKDDQLSMIIWAFKNGYVSHWSCYTKVAKT